MNLNSAVLLPGDVDRSARAVAWLGLDEEEGADAWESMMAGDDAAGHTRILRRRKERWRRGGQRGTRRGSAVGGGGETDRETETEMERRGEERRGRKRAPAVNVRSWRDV